MMQRALAGSLEVGVHCVSSVCVFTPSKVDSCTRTATASFTCFSSLRFSFRVSHKRGVIRPPHVALRAPRFFASVFHFGQSLELFVYFNTKATSKVCGGAGTVAQWAEPRFERLASCIRAPVFIPAVPLPTQFPAPAPWKAVEDGPNAWGLAGSSWLCSGPFCCSGHSGSESAGGRSLCFSLSL